MEICPGELYNTVMFKFLNLQPEVFAIDINDLSLKIALIKKRRRGFELVSYGDTPLRPGVVKEGMIRDEDALARTIKLACRSVNGKKLGARHVIVALPEEKSFSQVIQMPVMNEKELAGAVPFEVENYIPLPIEKVYLDFTVIGSHEKTAKQNHLDLLVNAAAKTVVDAYVASIKKAGLIPCILEAESQAIARALLQNTKQEKPMIFIDFGETRTSFIIYSGNSIRFTSSIAISSGQLTQAIAKKLGISFDKAEALKIKHGLATKKGDANHDIVSVMDPILSDLAMQIKKYISFYQGHISYEYFSADSGIEKMVLSGGGANLKELPDFLEKKLKIPVRLGDPVSNIFGSVPAAHRKIPLQKALSFTTVLGLALRGADRAQIP